MVQVNGYTLTLDNSHYDYNGRVIGQHATKIEKHYPDGKKFVCWHNNFVSAIGFMRMMKGV